MLHCKRKDEPRQALIASGVPVAETDGYCFRQDDVFTSPSIAAPVALGRSTDGRIERKDAQGRTLKALQAFEAGGSS